MNTLSNNYTKIFISLIISFLLFILVFKFQTQYNQELNQKIKISAENLYTDHNKILDYVKQIVYSGNHQEISSLENELEKMSHIESAEIYFSVNGEVSLSYYEFEPVVRVFSSENQSYYLDPNCKRIPLSEKYTADLILFTGHTENIKDHLILNLAKKINSNKFLSNQVSEVFINESSEAFFIPVIGSHKIKLGGFNNLEVKIKKMMTFYDKIIPKHGWEKYSEINLEYQNQIICLKND
ncbi:hypothetical protein OA405_00150 [Bacteroidota bacterium]|nr:hypothetical protein [Bacteroidota bacterium]MDC3115541.1 hypothetical protein [Bacteroidota bacterium]MDC3230045.1 hypothetical protein [Bacteroidota bacterium]